MSCRAAWLILCAVSLGACATTGVDAPVADARACDRFAARGGSDQAPGTRDAPFRTAQRLADALEPGQTGCLRAGTYDERANDGFVLKLRQGGTRQRRLTIQSYPGERARLRGSVYVPRGSPYVTVRDLDIDGRVPRLRGEPVTISVNAAGVRFTGNRITNRGLKSCMILGSNNDFGRARDTVVRRNVFADCGDPAHGMLDHGIYVQNSRGASILENVFYNAPGYAVQLYPNAGGTRVARNVMDDNGGGIVLGGEGPFASSRNVLTRNVITGSRSDYDIAASWAAGRVGTENVAYRNCLASAPGRGGVEPLGSIGEAHNLAVGPVYRDPGARDYRLARSSPCMDVLGSDVAAAAGSSR